jgi:hypothetical protein
MSWIKLSGRRRADKKLVQWLNEVYPFSSADFQEELEKCFASIRLSLPSSLRCCVAISNIIYSQDSRTAHAESLIQPMAEQ